MLESGWFPFVTGAARFMYRVRVDPVSWKVELEVVGERDGKERRISTHVAPSVLSNRGLMDMAALHLWNPPPVIVTARSAPLLLESDQID